MLKLSNYLLTLLLALTVTSCEPYLKFEEPQPTEDKDEKKFKTKFQGTYLCLEDSSILTIDKDKIVQLYHTITKLTIDEIDSTEGIELRDGLLYSEDIEEPLPVEFIDDKVVVTYEYDDSIFNISDDQVLRYFKGRYFLNNKEADNYWTVKTMTLDKEGLLTINSINGGIEEIEKIKQMTAVEEITDDTGKVVDYTVQPTRRELKEILKSEIIKESLEFQKIKFY